jgi:hypothetical protein
MNRALSVLMGFLITWSQSPAPLKIVVLAGEDAVNVVQQRTAVAPLVEVRDRNDQPVAGAVVTFSIQGGRAAFAAGANTLSVTTNAAGQAAVAGLTPTGAGVVQINVAATFQGQTAAAAITQTNFATAAQAASAGSGASGSSTAASGAGGGGGIGAGTITALTVAAAGVAGGLYGYQKYKEGDPPNVESVSLTPDVGLQGMTAIAVNGSMTWHGDEITGTADFGDGTVMSVSGLNGPLPELTHVYNTSGSFTVRLTITDAWDRSSSGTAPVTIKSLTGRWNLGNSGSFFLLTQSGSSVSGTFTAASGQGSGVVTGSTRPQPSLFAASGNLAGTGLTLNVTPTGSGVPSSFTGGTFIGGDQISGAFVSGSTTTTTSLIRQ